MMTIFRGSAEGDAEEPGQDQEHAQHFRNGSLFLEDQHPGEEPDRQTHLPERLDVADVGDVSHGEQDQRISGRAAPARHDRIQGPAEHFFEKRPFRPVPGHHDQFPESEPELDQEEISERVQDADPAGGFTDQLDGAAVENGVQGGADRPQQNEADCRTDVVFRRKVRELFERHQETTGRDEDHSEKSDYAGHFPESEKDRHGGDHQHRKRPHHRIDQGNVVPAVGPRQPEDVQHFPDNAGKEEDMKLPREFRQADVGQEEERKPDRGGGRRHQDIERHRGFRALGNHVPCDMEEHGKKDQYKCEKRHLTPS